MDDFLAIRNNISIASSGVSLTQSDNSGKIQSEHRFWPLVSLIATFPLWLLGKCFAIIPQLIIRLILKGIKDRHFVASVKFGVGLLLYTLIVLGILIWQYLNTVTVFWFIVNSFLFISCTFFVMMWEEHFQQFRGKRFMKD